MVFSTNQNRQLYVVDKVEALTETSAAKTIEVKSMGKGNAKDVFFKYKGADTAMKSDLIPVANIQYIKAAKAADMASKLKQVKVTLDTDVNGGNPISGQDYILTINFRQFYGMSDADQYQKFGAVHATSTMDKEKFYQKMAESLTRNFSKEIGTYLTFEATADGLTIKEVEQPWALGTYAQEQVYFEVLPGIVYSDGDEVIWGVTQKTGDTKDSKGEPVTPLPEAGLVKNGKKIADLEYFCMGERGDQYRNAGWPNVIPTKYLVDPDKEYNTLEIHYSFKDAGVSSYKSEKDITIVSESADVINSIVDALKTETGLDIEKLA